MKRILLTLCVALLVCFISSESYASSLLPNFGSSYVYNKQSDFKYVKTVNVYKLAYGRYVSDGKCEIYKNAKGYLFLKSNNKMYPVYNTSYPHSQYYKNFATDEWGYTVYFTV